MLSNSYYPQITLPTRFSERKGSLLDNIFCKTSPKCTPCSGILLSCISDHLPCFTCLNFVVPTPQSPKHIFKRDRKPDSIACIKRDIPELIETANIDKYIHANPNKNYDKIDTIIRKAIDMHMPMKKKLNLTDTDIRSIIGSQMAS